jgi:quinoprotein relay system zinc metallohydrolase 2
MAIAERGALFAQTRPPTGLARLALARLVAAGAAIVLCTAAAGAAIIATAAGADGFELAQPAPGVYVHLGRALALDVPGHDDIANVGFIVGKRCVAVIDTGGSVRVGRELRAAVRRHSSLPICFVINTHVHVDHVLGNFAFEGDRPSFVGHAALAAALARSRPYFLENYADDLIAPASPDQVIGPDRLIERDATIELGDRPLRLHAWPKAHTDCDLTVLDVRTSTLWTGDLLFRERLPALDGSIKGWLAAIDVLSGQRVRLVVPGHGAVTRDLQSALGPERRYLEAVLAGVRGEIERGDSMQSAIANVAGDQRAGWLLWDEVHPRNVARAYEELEWER